MKSEELLTHIGRKFGIVKKAGNQLYVNCPFCVKFGLGPNTTYKLGIHLTKHVYHCFRCDSKGRLSVLLPQIASLLGDAPIAQSEEVRELEQLPEIIPLNQIPYPNSEIVNALLETKNWDLNFLLPYASYCHDYMKGDFSFGPRLVFPIYMHHIYRGFQARTIYKNDTCKYVGATGMEKRTILYNYDSAFKQTKQLIIVEGFLDCLRVGHDCVATLGKTVSEEQIRIIKLGNFRRVIVFLDPDAYAESCMNANRLAGYFRTFIAHADAKDPGDMTHEAIRTLLEDKNKLERVF